MRSNAQMALAGLMALSAMGSTTGLHRARAGHHGHGNKAIRAKRKQQRQAKKRNRHL